MPPIREPSKLVLNERTKLLATGLNNLGIATVVAGTIGPLIARSYGAASASGILLPALLAIIYLSFGVGLMVLGRVTLGELTE